MSIFGQSKGHFLANIDIYACGPEKTKRNKPAFNGIRWAFAYADDVHSNPDSFYVSDVWPEFLDSHGASIETGVPLIGSYAAKMHIVFPEMIEKHFQKLSVGTQFYCMEGYMKAAQGRVTKLNL